VSHVTADQAMVRSNFARVEADRYWTEPWVTQALLSLVKFRGAIWEPACGRGDMANVLVDAGYHVIAGDIAGTRLGCKYAYQADFLEHSSPGDATFSIVTNPPFTLAEEFIWKALELTKRAGGMVAMLLRNEYDCAASRRLLFEEEHFAAKFILTKRPRWIDYGHTASPRHNFAWYLWDHHHTGPARLEWLP
jgi:hypothetical protein